MIFEGLSQLFSGIKANREHKKFADLLMQQNLVMPSGITNAESIYKQNATQGLPGYESYVADALSLLPGTLNTARQTVDNPSQLLEAVSRAQSVASNKIRDLGIADAGSKLQNEVAFAEFLSNVKAPMEKEINMFDINKTLAAQSERMLGQAEMWKGVGGFGSTLDGFVSATAKLGGGNIPGGFSQMFGNNANAEDDFGRYMMLRTVWD